MHNLQLIDPMSLQPSDMDTILRQNIIDMWFSENNLEDYKMFLLYWTEPGKNGKQRWQFEKTFEPRRRFFTWLRNAERFNPKPKNRICEL